jgi:hypothetical protein
MVTGRAGPRQFSIVARPQYHPKFGPIEYKICELKNIFTHEEGANFDNAGVRKCNLPSPRIN